MKWNLLNCIDFRVLPNWLPRELTALLTILIRWNIFHKIFNGGFVSNQHRWFQSNGFRKACTFWCWLSWLCLQLRMKWWVFWEILMWPVVIDAKVRIMKPKDIHIETKRGRDTKKKTRRKKERERERETLPHILWRTQKCCHQVEHHGTDLLLHESCIFCLWSCVSARCPHPKQNKTKQRDWICLQK